jgi:tripartite-type tricarboxylate transporter receptor subunit TctC
MPISHAIAGVLCALWVTCSASSAAAQPTSQAWPAAKPITIVVPVPPGPAVDFVARLVAEKLRQSLGQTVVVENRGGASGGIASTMVARAAPDGYTLIAATSGTHVSPVHLMKKLTYDPVKDFTPIMAAAEPVTGLVVNAGLPVKSVPELIAYAKAQPGKLTYGSSGVGSVFHVMGELLNHSAGIETRHVPYRGVALAIQDVIAGHIPMMFISVSSAAGALQDGKVRLLAVLEPQRYSKMPDVPSMSEFLPTFRKPSTWFGFLGPANMPRGLVARLNAEMVKAITAPDARARLEGTDLAIIAGTPEQFAKLLKDDIENFGAIVKAAGITPQ